jgi:hypothetical protein
LAKVERIPFAEAIGEKLLFKNQFDALTPGIKAILKSIYGLELSADDMSYWHAYHGGGKFDHLGYLLDVEDSGVTYRPGQEANDITITVGRRSTKTSGISSFICAYEALCGNHKEFVRFKSQSPKVTQVAQDIKTAQENLRQFIYDLLEESPIGKRELVARPADGGRNPVTALSLRLKNGMEITVGPPSIKLRGQAIPICAADELGSWSKDRESAMPDFEVARAIKPAMGSFPFAKFIKTSTPWTKEGLLWIADQTGSYGHKLTDPAQREAHSRTLVFRGPSAPLAPRKVLPRSWLVAEFTKDPDAFKREYLAEFADSISGFLSASTLEAATDKGITERTFDPRKSPKPIYVATMDPAFRGDAFAFAIGHMENGTYFLDWCQSWRGTREQPLSPTMVIRIIAGICKSYQIRMITSDQHHMESLQDIADQEGLVVDPCPLTNKNKAQMWGDVQSLLHQKKMRLLDHPGLLSELSKVEKRLTPQGQTQYSGTHDDLAMVLALNVYRALQFGETAPAKVEPEVALSDQVRQRILNRNQSAGGSWWNH